MSVTNRGRKKYGGLCLKNRTKENPDTDRLKNPAWIYLRAAIPPQARDLILVAELKSRLEIARVSMLEGRTRTPHGHLSWVNHRVPDLQDDLEWSSRWLSRRSPLLRQGSGHSVLGLRKPPDVRPAPSFSLQDFKENYKEESLIHTSPGEEPPFLPGGERRLAVEAVNQGLGTPGQPSDPQTWEPEHGPESSCSPHHSVILGLTWGLWKLGMRPSLSEPPVSHPLVPENPSLWLLSFLRAQQPAPTAN